MDTLSPVHLCDTSTLILWWKADSGTHWNGPIFFCHQAVLLICSSAAKWKISQEAHGQSGHLGVVGLGSEFFHFS